LPVTLLLSAINRFSYNNFMRDERKFRIAAVFATVLCVLAIAYNVAQEYFIPDIEAYIQRRIYYERVISKKGLSMHKADYWSKEGD